MPPKQYRKRPVVVEAMQLSKGNIEEVSRWCGGKRCATHLNISEQYILIETSEGEMRADFGDYIIKEPFSSNRRRFYPCKPHQFEPTYEEVIGVTQ